MNELNRKKVIVWMKKQKSDSTLEIYDFYGEKGTIKIPKADEMSLDELVYKIIGLCASNGTRIEYSKKFQCGAAHRTIFDTWRMCKYYFPNTSIFDVMHVLHRLVQAGKLHSWKCIVLHEYVFMPANRGYSSLYDATEFGFSYNSLGDI